MIKLQDFAQSMGVTDRAIQKHIKKYAEELDGLIERKGPNGTWLTDEACEILRSKMKQQPMAIYEEDPRVVSLQQEVEELRRQLDKANEDFRRYAAGTAEALSKATAQLQLAERAEAYRTKAQEAEERAAVADERAEQAQGALDLAVGEKLDLQAKLEETEERARAAEAEAERLKKRGLIARIFNLKE